MLKDVNWKNVGFILFIIVYPVVVIFGGVYLILLALLGVILYLWTLIKHYKEAIDLRNSIIDSYKSLLEKKDDLVGGMVPEHILKDRIYLLLLLAQTFHMTGRLRLEKKHPNATNIVLVFQLAKGNLRFSVPEGLIPDPLFSMPIRINDNKVNYVNNYKLITELLKDLNNEKTVL